jgi:hypothetical protein
MSTFAPTGPDCDRAVATILREIADTLEGGNHGMVITRLGVTLGSWGYEPKTEERKVQTAACRISLELRFPRQETVRSTE